MIVICIKKNSIVLFELQKAKRRKTNEIDRKSEKVIVIHVMVAAILVAIVHILI